MAGILPSHHLRAAGLSVDSRAPSFFGDAVASLSSAPPPVSVETLRVGLRYAADRMLRDGALHASVIDPIARIRSRSIERAARAEGWLQWADSVPAASAFLHRSRSSPESTLKLTKSLLGSRFVYRTTQYVYGLPGNISFDTDPRFAALISNSGEQCIVNSGQCNITEDGFTAYKLGQIENYRGQVDLIGFQVEICIINLAPLIPALRNAITEAERVILGSKLPPDVMAKAFENIRLQNFTTNTVGAGGVRNSVQIRYCSGKPC